MAGIVVKGGGKVFINGATITENGGGGVIVEEGSFVDMDGANISNNFGDGVSVDNSQITAVNAVIENNGIEAIYFDLEIDRTMVNDCQLEFFIDQALDGNLNGSSQILKILSNTAVFSGIATTDPFIAVASAIAACSVATLQRYKSFFSS